jgi:hypothetical protein
MKGKSNLRKIHCVPSLNGFYMGIFPPLAPALTAFAFYYSLLKSAQIMMRNLSRNNFWGVQSDLLPLGFAPT